MNAFLAVSDITTLGSFLFPLVIIAMGMSIPIVAIITEHLEKKERLRLIEKAIEHGADLKDLHLEEQMAEKNNRPRLPYRSGMILVATGIALAVSHRFLDASFGSIHVPLLVAGLITGFIGIAQLINDWINRNRLDNQNTQTNDFR